MFKLNAALAAGAAAVLIATAPAFAGETFTQSVMVIADIGHDVNALSTGKHAEAKIVRASPADWPAFEQISKVGGTAGIAIDLDANGAITSANVASTSGHPRLDASALQAVRASKFAAASVDGQGIGGKYVVEVTFDPAN